MTDQERANAIVRSYLDDRQQWDAMRRNIADAFAALRAESQLHWTTTKPTSEGWYWWKEFPNSDPTLHLVWEVSEENPHDELDGLCFIDDDGHARSVARDGYRWAGPLVPPEEG